MEERSGIITLYSTFGCFHVYTIDLHVSASGGFVQLFFHFSENLL